MSTSTVRTPQLPPNEQPSGTAATLVDRGGELISVAADRWGAAALRISIGLIMVGFGALKFVPGLSPAEPLATKAVDLLTFGVVSGQAALVTTAVVEVTIGLLLISGRFPRVAVVLLAGCIAGWMSPLVLFPGDLITATGPALVAQYLIKDIVFAAAALVIAGQAFRRRAAG